LTIAGLNVYTPVLEATCELVRSIEIEHITGDGQVAWYELRDDADYVTVSYTDFKFDLELD
jgi:pectate lyase